jgi:hypothetical protein
VQPRADQTAGGPQRRHELVGLVLPGEQRRRRADPARQPLAGDAVERLHADHDREDGVPPRVPLDRAREAVEIALELPFDFLGVAVERAVAVVARVVTAAQRQEQCPLVVGRERPPERVDRAESQHVGAPETSACYREDPGSGRRAAQRQTDPEGRSDAHGAVDLHAPAVGVHDLLRDGETEAGARRRRRGWWRRRRG